MVDEWNYCPQCESLIHDDDIDAHDCVVEPLPLPTFNPNNPNGEMLVYKKLVPIEELKERFK